MRHYGLIGYPLGHSFSEQYFTEKFAKEHVSANYKLFELSDVVKFRNLLSNNDLSGLNVTIPYKETIMDYLDELDETARLVGAVNTIKFCPNGHLKGYNTDVIGFEQTLRPILKSYHQKALVLGTGGASKAVAFVLRQLNIDFKFVSRTKTIDCLAYSDLSQTIMSEYLLIVNTTPLGMFPNIHTKPPIPYQWLSDQYLLYDLVYNPLKTEFLQAGEEYGATVQNGLPMLRAQAEASYLIWTE
ncbi:MAG: shikimate dehydrogenase [Paludibacteraceae bacterium]|nr:shikimate dehydrogenase [Paludibacteraceae bacterium]